MLELPTLTPERFEILVVRELRKVGLEVSELRIHRRTTLPEPEQGYLLELAGAVSRAPWRRRVLIACRRQDAPVGRAEVTALRGHLQEAGAEAGILFATSTFDPDALKAAQEGALALLRVTDGRTAFDTSGWGTPGHYPAWLPAYCAQAVSRDAMGQLVYRLLEGGQGDVIVQQLETAADRAPRNQVEPGNPVREAPPAG
jgi:Restriction endonuclease